MNNITSAQYLHVGIAIAIFSMCDFEVTFHVMTMTWKVNLTQHWVPQSCRLLVLFLFTCLFSHFYMICFILTQEYFTSWSLHMIQIHHPTLKVKRGRRRGTSTYSQSALWRGMPLNLGVFSWASLFCVQAKEVHCAGRHPEKRGELGAVVCWCFCSARALKRPE